MGPVLLNRNETVQTTFTGNAQGKTLERKEIN